MKFRILVILNLILAIRTFSQSAVSQIDSLKLLIKNKSINDTTKVFALDQLSLKLMGSNMVEAYKYATEGLKLANNIDFAKGKVRMLNRLGLIYTRTGNFALSLKTAYEAIAWAEKIKDTEGLGKIYNNMSIFYSEQNDLKNALIYDKKTLSIAEKTRNESLYETAMINISADYISLNYLDSARYYLEKIYAIQTKNIDDNYRFNTLQNIANVDFLQKDYTNALAKYRICVQHFIDRNNDKDLGETYLLLAEQFQAMDMPDSSIYYSKKAYELAFTVKNTKLKYQSTQLLAKLFENKDTDQAFKYFKIAISAKDSLFNIEKLSQLRNVEISEKIRQQQLIDTEKEFMNKLKYGLLIGLLLAFIIISFIQYRNNQQKHKANQMLETQKNEIEVQKVELNHSLETLKATQKQMIQQEKLASLGELTAGIAHEIQNPLNFVNNFSELNIELLDEINIERQKPQTIRNEVIENELMSDLMQNQEKILLHGNRASGIVKAMLDHSRTNSGQKISVDLNLLADEFLKLSYLSIRAKYKNFNSDYELIEDKDLPKIEAVSQDIGRVLLNLFNNGFYSMYEKMKQTDPNHFKPKLTVTTSYLPTLEISGRIGFVQIKVQDNGIGIGEAIKDKIFQPFFTTKPTGEGTGLGLSLSYDIITKGHLGTISIETIPETGTAFTINLPVSQKNTIQ
jgi:two-component system, NtrC family, sensor kinase